MNILSQLTKARFALKRKFDDLKQVKNHTNLQLEETFKPIKAFTAGFLSNLASKLLKRRRAKQ